MKPLKVRSGCPLSSVLDIIGDKWSLLIVRDILMNGKNTYNEFLRSKERIATNVLADRLSLLETTGILAREEHPESKAKIFYRLTDKGIDLLPVLVELILWSNAHLPIDEAARSYGEALKRNKEAMIRQLMVAARKQ